MAKADAESLPPASARPTVVVDALAERRPCEQVLLTGRDRQKLYRMDGVFAHDPPRGLTPSGGGPRATEDRHGIKFSSRPTDMKWSGPRHIVVQSSGRPPNSPALVGSRPLIVGRRLGERTSTPGVVASACGGGAALESADNNLLLADSQLCGSHSVEWFAPSILRRPISRPRLV